MTLGKVFSVFTTMLICTTSFGAQTNDTGSILRWGENGRFTKWDKYSYPINSSYPYFEKLPTLDEFPKMLSFSGLHSSDRNILLSQLRTLSRCDFLDFQKQDYDAAFHKWSEWWNYYGSKAPGRLNKEGRTYPDVWKSIAPGFQLPAYPLALPSIWSFRLTFGSGDYDSIVKEEISMSVSENAANLKRRYRTKTQGPWVSEEWQGLTVEQSQSFLASVVYAIDNPWIYANDKLAAPQGNHIKGRPNGWVNYYPSVEWTGILDPDGRIIINDDAWSWDTTNYTNFPGLDCPIGVVFRVVRDEFPDPTWNKEHSRWKMVEADPAPGFKKSAR